MNEPMIDLMNDSALSPAQYITLMFERTDQDGVLYIPGWHYFRPGWGGDCENDEETLSYRCKVNWNLYQYEEILKEFNQLYADLEELGKHYEDLISSHEPASYILGNHRLAKVWDLYLAPLDDGPFDYKKYEDIFDRMDSKELAKQIASRMGKGETLEEFEKSLLVDAMEINVSREEEDYCNQYLAHRQKEAEKRLGAGICAYDVYFRAWRVCRLFSLGAPKIVIEHTARQFAAALVLHRFGSCKELVDNTIRLRIEKMETMTEEELDELYRPRKTNTRRSLAPLFVYEILNNKSNTKKHLRQSEILKELGKYPYEISLERKALSRILHNLEDSGYGIHFDSNGVWIDKEL